MTFPHERQACKFWPQAARFAACNGSQAFQLKRSLEQDGISPDYTYGGFGSNWKAMWAVLRAKFQPGPLPTSKGVVTQPFGLGSPLATRLVETGDSFLLEHNERTGRDLVWSDNQDGTGSNWLG